MALTVRKITDQQIESAKFLTGRATASAAVVDCVDLAYRYHNELSSLKEDNRRLRDRVAVLEQAYGRFADAADHVLTLGRQGELYNA